MDEPHTKQIFYDVSDDEDFRNQFVENSFEAFENEMNSETSDDASPAHPTYNPIADQKYLISHTTSDSFGVVEAQQRLVKAHLIKIANLKAEIQILQTKILLQRSIRTANELREKRMTATGTLFVSSFADLSVKIDEFRNSHNVRTDSLKSQNAKKDEEIILKEGKLAELDKKLLSVSIQFSTIKKEIQRKSRKSLLSRLFW